MSGERKGEKSNTDQAHAELLALFENATNDIRFGKQQQWNVAYYVLLVFASIVAMTYSLGDFSERIGPDFKIVLEVGTVAVAVAGIYLVFSFQAFMCKQRRTLNRLYRLHFHCEFAQARGSPQIDVSFLKDPEITLAIVAVELTGCCLVTWVLTESAFDVAISGLVLLILTLIFLLHFIRQNPAESPHS